MQHIGLIGVPGSGKTALAGAIEEYLIKDDGQCTDCNTPVGIVDEYAEWLGDHGDWALGFDGGYVANVGVAIERYNRERIAIRDNKTVITCGTVLETAVYSAMRFEQQAEFKTDEEMVDEAKRIEGSLKILACMYMDAFHYSSLFYLPPFRTGEDKRLAVLDRNLQASFQAFEVATVQPLTIDEEISDLKELTARRLEMVFPRKEANAGQATR